MFKIFGVNFLKTKNFGMAHSYATNYDVDRLILLEIDIIF